MAEANVIANVDNAIGDFFSQWNIVSTIIAGFLLLVLVYPLFAAKEPDTHPFLLIRQSQASPIRQEGESAVFRSTDIPYGYPLRSGIAVKDPGASKWTSGRDGDVRDIWRQAVTGQKKEDGTVIGPPAKITTILGVQSIVEHDMKDLTTQINIIGKYIHDAGGRRVAVCLSNSVELICTVFAGSFYTFSPILIPFSQTPPETTPLLVSAEYDTLIAEAGSVALEHVLAKKPSIRRVIWVAKAGNKHLDWDEVPEGVGGKVDVTTWHELIDEKRATASSEVPALDVENQPMPIYTMFTGKGHKHEITEYASRNLIAATAALQANLPRNSKLNSTDSVLPTVSLTSTYALTWTLLTLFSGSTLLLNSVSGSNINLLAATKSARERIKPTIIITHAETISKFTTQLNELFTTAGLGAKYTRWSNSRLLQQDTMLGTKVPAYLPSAFTGLKTLYIEQPAGGASTRVTSAMIASLRSLLGARVGLALTAQRVAGPITQTNVYDYRDKGDVCCVGPPVGSLELHLAGDEVEMGKTLGVIGDLVVRGPAVVGNVEKKEKVTVQGVRAKVDTDGTILLV